MPQGEDQRENPSVLFCQNVAHWSTDATWRITFEDEEVEVIAVGGGMTGFVAAATSKRYVQTPVPCPPSMTISVNKQ